MKMQIAPLMNPLIVLLQNVIKNQIEDEEKIIELEKACLHNVKFIEIALGRREKE